MKAPRQYVERIGNDVNDHRTVPRSARRRSDPHYSTHHGADRLCASTVVSYLAKHPWNVDHDLKMYSKYGGAGEHQECIPCTARSRRFKPPRNRRTPGALLAANIADDHCPAIKPDNLVATCDSAISEQEADITLANFTRPMRSRFAALSNPAGYVV